MQGSITRYQWSCKLKATRATLDAYLSKCTQIQKRIITFHEEGTKEIDFSSANADGPTGVHRAIDGGVRRTSECEVGAFAHLQFTARCTQHAHASDQMRRQSRGYSQAGSWGLL